MTRSLPISQHSRGSTWTAAACALALAAACAAPPEPPPDPTRLVASQLEGNRLGIQASDLKVMGNPHGEGQFVYVERTLFDEGSRYLIWLVLDDTAYTINGHTNHMTPDLPFPIAAGDVRWARTGLDPRRATAALDVVFPDR